MSDLRETLARRFHHAWWQSTPTPEGEELFQIPPGFYGLADECIRQMRWASQMSKEKSSALIKTRDDGEHQFVSISDVIHVHDVCHEVELTAAPDNWQVPK